MAYMGLKLVWWLGVVEDINDPLKLGRARVRIFGHHTSDKSKIPTKSLPWALPINPLSGASINGIGFSATGLVQGSWVIGFFRDETDAQEPVMFGTIPGIPEDFADPKIGFNDPDGVYPKFLHEPDTNRLARHEGLTGTILKTKSEELEKYIPTGLGGEWSEPVSSYNAVYPKNKVYETESGHIVEFDDTPDAERINIHHKSGTFFEIHPDGTNITKVKGNNYEIVLSDNRILIKGENAINVDGDTKFRGSNVDIEISNDAKIFVAGDMITQVDGDYIHKTKGNASILADGNLLLVGNRIDLNPDGINSADYTPGYSVTTPSNEDESTDKLGYTETEIQEANINIPDYGDPFERTDYGNISQLGDTAITTLNDGNTLVWDGESWAGRQLKVSETYWDAADLGSVELE